MLKVTIKKILIGSFNNKKATAACMGEVSIGDSIVHKDDAVLAGKLKVIGHLVVVEKA